MHSYRQPAITGALAKPGIYASGRSSKVSRNAICIDAWIFTHQRHSSIVSPAAPASRPIR